MKIEVTIPLNIFRACATHAAKNDIRGYLNGIYIDWLRGKVVATDGNRLLAVTVPSARAIVPRGGPDAAVSDIRDGIIIPKDTVSALFAAYKGAHYSPIGSGGSMPVTVSVQWENRTESGVLHYGEVRASIVVPSGVLTFIPANITLGRYPDYVRVIPQSIGDYEFSTLNPEYVADALAALAAVAGIKPGKTPVSVYTRGTDSAIVPGYECADYPALAVIMPQRGDSLDKTRAAVVRELFAVHAVTDMPATESAAA